jgi:hypothetical protein
MSDEEAIQVPPTQPLRRKRGRPPFDPPWLKEAARMVGQGTPLRRALWRLGIHDFTEAQLKGMYRLVRFRRYMEEAKIEYYRTWGRLPRRSRTRPIERLLRAVGLGDLQ